MLHLHFKAYGHGGHPLIILHGLLGMLDNWQTQARSFSGAGFKVYALDQRNHGRSPHSDTFNYRVMANDLFHFMQEHRIPSAHILGHSMGGKTAMQFALTYPERVDKLIVVDVAPRTYPNAHDHVLHAMCSLKLGTITSRREADAALAERLPDWRLRQFVLKNLTRDEAGRLKWKVNLSIIKKHYPEIAGDITATGIFSKPTLFIKAALSNYLIDDDLPRITTLFPRAVIISIADAGHWVHVDTPDEFGNEVLKFLRS